MASPSLEPLPLSVAIICMNSERTIERTLESVAGLASEIVCIDSGSTDSTPDICRRAGVVFEHQAWLGHIKQKQVALGRCTQPWILCLDSDESLEPTLRASLRETLEAESPHDGYEVNRKVFYKGRMLHHAWQPEWRLRLVRRGRARWGGYDPHDKLELTEPGATAGRLAGDLRHDSFIDMIDYLTKQIALSRKAAESYRRLGRRTGPIHLVTSPSSAWLKQMVMKGAWRDGWRGWAAASGTAVAALMKHLILLEETRFEKAEQRDG
jgi:glycosyltransferase involved in cell wall biosynthesis